MKPTLTILAAALLLAAPLAPARANAPALVQVRVSTAGLDLESPAGADAMLRRLRRAATQACGDRPVITPLDRSLVRRFEACRSRALAQAVADLGSPTVSRRHAPRPEPIRLLARR